MNKLLRLIVTLVWVGSGIVLFINYRTEKLLYPVLSVGGWWVVFLALSMVVVGMWVYEAQTFKDKYRFNILDQLSQQDKAFDPISYTFEHEFNLTRAEGERIVRANL